MKARRPRGYKGRKARVLPNAQPESVVVMGLRACEALFAKRAEAILRVSYGKVHEKRFEKLIRWCAAHKRSCRAVAEEELRSIAKSEHHEGIVILSDAPSFLPLPKLLNQFSRDQDIALCVLCGVSNPHNFGAIIRVAAYFGLDGIVLCESSIEKVSGATVRVAEGGAEAINLASSAGIDETLSLLHKADIATVATSPHSKTNFFQMKIPRRVAYVFGAEGEGLSQKGLQLAQHAVAIPGSGEVESLNVACATAVVLGEHWRQRKATTRL